MPRKKSASARKKTGFVTNKSAFVRSLPRDMPAKTVVEEGKKQGISLSEKYVYVIRSNSKAKGSAGPRAGRAAAAGASRKDAGLEAQLRSTIAELGLARARQVFASVEAAFSG
jgi:hypothetical protein